MPRRRESYIPAMPDVPEEAPDPRTTDLARERAEASARLRERARTYAASLLVGDPRRESDSVGDLERAGRAFGDLDQAAELAELAEVHHRTVPGRSGDRAERRAIRATSSRDPGRDVPVGDLVASALSLLLDATGFRPFDVAIRSGIPESTVRGLIEGDVAATLNTVASVGKAAGGQLIFGFVPIRQGDPEADRRAAESIVAELAGAARAFAAAATAARSDAVGVGASPEWRALRRATLRFAAHAGVPGAAMRAELESLRELKRTLVSIRDDMASGRMPDESSSFESLDTILRCLHVTRQPDPGTPRWATRALAPRAILGSEARWVAPWPLQLVAISVTDDEGGQVDEVTMEVSILGRPIARGSSDDVERILRESRVRVDPGGQIAIRARRAAPGPVLTAVPIVERVELGADGTPEPDPLPPAPRSP